MKIVLTDCATVVSNSDLDLTRLEAFGDVTYYDETPAELTAERIKDADVVILNKTVIGKRELDAAKNLKLIALFATGYNNIDIEYAREKGIVVCNVPGYSTDSVTQVTVSLMLELASSTSSYVSSVANGDWKRSSQFSYFSYPISEISGKTLGIYGLGTIGMSVARVALAFGMKVIAYTRTPKQMDGVEAVSETELFERSDYLSFHCPLTDKTAKTVNERTLALMKPTACIINTARGGVIDEYALADALKNKKIRAAALDVLTYEPMAADCPLFGIENCIITPHIAWASIEARTRLIGKVSENLSAFCNGTPINVVNT